MNSDRPKDREDKGRTEKDAAKKARLAKLLRKNLAKRKGQAQIRKELPPNITKDS